MLKGRPDPSRKGRSSSNRRTNVRREIDEALAATDGKVVSVPTPDQPEPCLHHYFDGGPVITEEYDMEGVGFCDHGCDRSLQEKYVDYDGESGHWEWFCSLCEHWWNRKEDVRPSYEIPLKLRQVGSCGCAKPMEDPDFNPGFCLLCGNHLRPNKEVTKVCSHLGKYGHSTIGREPTGFLGLGDSRETSCTRCSRHVDSFCGCGAWREPGMRD